MKIALDSQTRTNVALGALLILLGSCGFMVNQVQYANRRAHADARWDALEHRIVATCGHKERS